VSDTFRFVPEQVRAGDVPGAATAFTDAFLRVGYLGVPLFMILSGLSLTMVAMRRETPPGGTPLFLYRRLRRVMIPYWFGFVYTLAFAGALAFVQWQRHGGHGYQWFVQRRLPHDGGQLFAAGCWSRGSGAPSGTSRPRARSGRALIVPPAVSVLLRPRRIGPWFFPA
jgi:peptidoglycan/LPS O-acetylase OafA/YrhL